MKTSISTLAVLACLSLSTCDSASRSPGPSTATAEIQKDTIVLPTSALAGEWSGSANIVVNWVKQKTLPVHLQIAADGTVTGKVGDATLADAKLGYSRSAFERSMGWGRDFRIHGRLQGDLVAAEKVNRDAVDIVFNQAADGSLTGGLATSGWEVGGPDTMKLSAGKMVLRKSAAPLSRPAGSTAQ